MSRCAWTKTTLGDQLTFQRGFDITKDEQSDGPYPVYSSSGPKSTHFEYKLEGPGLIIGRKGTLGSAFFEEGRYWPHDTTLWVKDFRGNDAKFAYYFVQTMHFEQYDAGASNPSLNRNHIHSIPILWPSLEEQRRIAGILSAYDDLIENCQRRIRILEEMARSLYREWFVHFRYPGHESVPRVLHTLGLESVLAPPGWDVRQLKDVCQEVRRNVPKGALNELVPYVGLEHIPRRSMALDDWETTSELGSNKLEFRQGEVLFGKIRPYFHKVSVAPFDGLCSADTIVIRAKQPKYSALVTALVSSDGFVAQSVASSNGSKMPRANWHVLEKTLFFVPPERLLEQFSDVFDVAIREQQILVRQAHNLRQTRDLLLKKLLLSSPSRD